MASESQETHLVHRLERLGFDRREVAFLEALHFIDGELFSISMLVLQVADNDELEEGVKRLLKEIALGPLTKLRAEGSSFVQRYMEMLTEKQPLPAPDFDALRDIPERPM